MSVTIRLARHGQTKRPYYRIVAADKERWRDGRFLEVLGNYNPMREPAAITLKEDRIRHCIEVGAQTSALVNKLIKRQIPGLLEAKEEHRKSKKVAARKKRKTRLASGGKKPAAAKTTKAKSKK